MGKLEILTVQIVNINMFPVSILFAHRLHTEKNERLSKLIRFFIDSPIPRVAKKCITMDCSEGDSGDDAPVVSIGETPLEGRDQVTAIIKSKKKGKKKKKSNKNATPSSEMTRVITEAEVNEICANAFFSTSEINRWFSAYQEAFREEHEWLEGSGHPTSRGMKLSGARMYSLVFQDEKGSALKRVCYVATVQSPDGTDSSLVINESGTTASNDSHVCGYATIDEDPNMYGVCHLRMLLVPQTHQRMGLGAQILRHIVNCERFSTRHIGLKYAKCHNYECFYKKAGFIVIGSDDLYVYMALRR